MFRRMGAGGGGRVKEPRDQVSTNKASQLPSREATFCSEKSPGQKSFIPTVDLIFLPFSLSHSLSLFFFFFKLGVRISLLGHHARGI